MSEQKHGVATPKGTAPAPTRRNTKHKRPEYGDFLMARHAARKQARAVKKETERIRLLAEVEQLKISATKARSKATQ